MNIPDLIRIGRARKNLSQKELAEKVGIVPSAVSQWESGNKIPSGDVLIRLALVLDIVPELFPGYEKVDADKGTLEERVKALEEKTGMAPVVKKKGLTIRELRGLIEQGRIDEVPEDFKKLGAGLMAVSQFLQSGQIAERIKSSLGKFFQIFGNAISDLREQAVKTAMEEGRSREEAEKYVDELSPSENEEFWAKLVKREK